MIYAHIIPISLLQQPRLPYLYPVLKFISLRRTRGVVTRHEQYRDLTASTLEAERFIGTSFSFVNCV